MINSLDAAPTARGAARLKRHPAGPPRAWCCRRGNRVSRGVHSNGKRPSDGNELSPLGKVVYKPFGLALGLLSGLLAGRIFGLVWKRVSGEDETPKPLADEYSTREVLVAAAVQGAIFGLIKAAVDRYGMKGVRRFLDAPLPPARRRAHAG